MKIFLKNGYLVDPYRNFSDPCDLYVEDGVMVESFDPAEADLIFDLEGLHVFPGLIDAHVHLRDPGYEYKEDIVSGTRAAARGGFTAVATMPNTRPICDSPSLIRYQIDKAEREGSCQILPIGAVSKGELGNELAEIGLMHEAGAVAVSDDGIPVKDAAMMSKAMLYADRFDMVVINHCEDLSLAAGGAMNEGIVSLEMGLKGIPAISEDVMVARDLILAEYLNLPVHLAHLSTKGSVDWVRSAKTRGVKATCETCPHYFVLTEEAVRGYDTNAKMNPPLRTETDRLAIIEGLRDGTIDLLVTDHAPHHEDEKDLEFALAKNGIVGLETAFPLSYTHLVKTGVLTLAEMIRLWTVNPARLLKQPLDGLAPGAPANLMVADLATEYQFDKHKMASKARNTPFHGHSMSGQPVLTLWKGRVTHQILEPSVKEQRRRTE